MDNEKVETFCKRFASYVTGTWRNNHLHIYVDLSLKPPMIFCYGFGQINWTGSSNIEYPFHPSLVDLIQSLPAEANRLSVEFFCGKVCKAEIN